MIPAAPTGALAVTLTAISPSTHRVAFLRADGPCDQAVLDTRSFLVHDLLHFAIESEAGFSRAFYGRFAGGACYRALAVMTAADFSPAADNEAWLAQMLVGPLTPIARGQPLPPGFVASLSEMMAAHGVTRPAWLDDDFLTRALGRFRRLSGHWKAAPFGQPMRLEFGASLD